MTEIIYSDDYRQHDTGVHVENQKRVQAIMKAINKSFMTQNSIHQPEPASDEDILRVHTRDHVEYIRKFCQKGGGYIDFDTVVSPHSYETAKLAAGGAIKAADLVLEGFESAYSVARPPGHHATRDRAMGFCIFNNLAITLEHLRSKNIRKFLVFDFDVHYGNGTADIFYQDPDVLYISIHQDPHTIFPGKGFIYEIGADEGEGANLNIPMPPGSNKQDYQYILGRILEPIVNDFGADFYLVDVGFDGHKDDPLSSINLNDDFFEWVAVEMMRLAGSLCLILEGGYDIAALSRSNLKMMNGLRNYKEIKDQIADEKQDISVNKRTQNLYQDIKETFSPYFDL